MMRSKPCLALTFVFRLFFFSFSYFFEMVVILGLVFALLSFFFGGEVLELTPPGRWLGCAAVDRMRDVCLLWRHSK